MTNVQTQLEQLQLQIGQNDPNTRFRFQPQLHNLITTMEKQGENIPQKTKRLHGELLAESIEALFDNMPV